ncbi:vWA domain-containing protein [uncultured Methanobrevibacter sp.]|uniref:vWA domain-containing protein n=1 Tax=uncultured Methanobrevibacter sp. TaxID=253161 RepID=UPI002621E03B|nr:vWA domain-containing protein [uncultured Methanobrevibacter sp.]
MGNLNDLKNVTTVKSFKSLNDSSEVDMDLVFVLDKSGSMWDVEKDTIGGFNSFIRREKENGKNTRVTLVLFDDEYHILYTRKPIDEVSELTSDEYYASGCTALLDAIGRTIMSLDGEVAKKVMFVITTDGLENASTQFKRKDVKKLIESHDWEFLFIGADIDSYSEAQSLGITGKRAANYEKSSAGLGTLFSSVSRFRYAYDTDSKEEMDRGWKEDLD